MPPPSPLAVAHVSPFALEAPGDVGEAAEALARELGARGHRVLIVAPSQSAGLVRDSRRALRADPSGLLERAAEGPVVVAVGEVLPFAPTRRRTASLPVDVARTIEELLGSLPLDVVHVHEPFAPSASAAALRHSRALNVGSFHAPDERVLSTQLAAPLTRLLFSRLDARIASYGATRDLLGRYFPGSYDLVLPAAPTLGLSAPDDGPVTLCFVADEERGALRMFLRALRGLPEALDWRATVIADRPLAAPATLSHRLQARVRFLEATGPERTAELARAQLCVFASGGDRVRPGTVVRALGLGLVPVASRLPAYEELLAEGRHGLLFEPGDGQTLTAQLARAIGDRGLRTRLRTQADPFRRTLRPARVADEVEAIYARLVARRHDGRAQPALARRLRQQPLVDVDLHMHTDHSPDCATPVEVLLAEAVERGLGAIAVTDHNEISGALEAQAKAPSELQVIVGEEVKTADQGEVIGLFISEKIPRGMTLAETISEIRRQGGVVYVPHPFDRLHSVPDYEHLLAVLDEVDAIEVFNPRVAISEFNEEAVRFAAKYRIPAGAGSDAHVPQGLGSVRIRMRRFDGAEEFVESLRDADIVRNPASLLYVQALKFLQTRALPESARRASRDRRVRRAARKS